jgi:hypothetical protein
MLRQQFRRDGKLVVLGLLLVKEEINLPTSSREIKYNVLEMTYVNYVSLIAFRARYEIKINTQHFDTETRIIISLLMSPALGHKPFLWIAHN